MPVRLLPFNTCFKWPTAKQVESGSGESILNANSTIYRIRTCPGSQLHGYCKTCCNCDGGPGMGGKRLIGHAAPKWLSLPSASTSASASASSSAPASGSAAPAAPVVRRRSRSRSLESRASENRRISRKRWNLISWHSGGYLKISGIGQCLRLVVMILGWFVTALGRMGCKGRHELRPKRFSVVRDGKRRVHTPRCI